jgi:hypothetical protein
MKALWLALALLAGPALAQDVKDAPGARLRLLDKESGNTQDLELSNGQSVTVGRLTVLLDSCRYYPDNPADEAFAHLTILDAAKPDPVFNGWMTASSPALSALDHPRYDVWVLRCDVPDVALPEVADPPPEEAPPEDPPVEDPAATDGGNG